MTTPAGDGKTPHRARNLFDGIDLASNTMKVCLGSQPEVSDGHENVGFRGKSGRSGVPHGMSESSQEGKFEPDARCALRPRR